MIKHYNYQILKCMVLYTVNAHVNNTRIICVHQIFFSVHHRIRNGSRGWLLRYAGVGNGGCGGGCLSQKMSGIPNIFWSCTSPETESYLKIHDTSPVATRHIFAFVSFTHYHEWYVRAQLWRQETENGRQETENRRRETGEGSLTSYLTNLVLLIERVNLSIFEER